MIQVLQSGGVGLVWVSLFTLWDGVEGPPALLENTFIGTTCK